MLSTNGFDGLAEAVTVLLSSAMVAERSEYVRAAPYERSAERIGYANGYKDEAMKTQLGCFTAELIVSDAHEGLKAAREAVFPSVPWQRYQFHLQQNAGHYAPKMAMRTAVAADIRGVSMRRIEMKLSCCWRSS